MGSVCSVVSELNTRLYSASLHLVLILLFILGFDREDNSTHTSLSFLFDLTCCYFYYLDYRRENVVTYTEKNLKLLQE